MPKTLLSGAAFVLFASSAFAQGLQRAPGGSGGGGLYGYEQGWTYSIFMPQVQHELELVENQLQKMNEIRTTHYKKQQELYKELYKDGTPSALAREFHNERVAELREEMAKQLGKALLPHQVKRAKEVWLQTQVGRGGYAFSNAGVRELLGVTPEQYQQIVKRSNELNAEIMKKYAELRAEAAEELMKELTPEQRKKLADLSGEKYEPVKIDYRKWNEQRRAAQQKERGREKKQGEGKE